MSIDNIITAQIKANQVKSRQLLKEQLSSLENTDKIVQESNAAYKKLQELNAQLKAINQDTFQRAGELAKETPKKGLLKRFFKG